MSDQRPPIHMPAPRDHDDPTLSELVPFRSTKINLKKSPAFYFLLVLALTVPLMFGALYTIGSSKTDAQFLSNVRFYSLVMTGVICLMLQTMVFMYSRTERSYLHFMIPFAFAAVALMTPIFQLYAIPFRNLWPFWNPKAQGFVPAFLAMFSGAGLLEELLKATPILLGAWLGIRMKTDPSLAQNKAVELLHIRGPLDGAVMGAFAGAGFTFIETGIEYVPGEVARMAQQTQNVGIGLASAFLLLIPRALGAAIGHMAYSGIFGYFIGLAVLRPKHMWKLFGIGWLAAATIHGLWNSVAQIHFALQFVIAIVSAIGLASVMLKARQLEGVRTGVAAESHGSIIVERPHPAASYVPAGVGATPYQPQGIAAPVPPPAAPYQPAAAPPSVPAAAQALTLDVEGLQIPLRADGAIDLAAEPALGGRGAGVTGAVVAHPTRAGVLGLRNTGTVAWTARLRDGSQQQIERDQNIRLAPGVTIAFGSGLIGSVVAAG